MADSHFVDIGLLGQHNTIAGNEIIESGVMAAMLSLICSAKHKSQLAGLQVLASLALVSDAAAQKLMSQRLLTALQVSTSCSYIVCNDLEPSALSLYSSASMCICIATNSCLMFCVWAG